MVNLRFWDKSAPAAVEKQEVIPKTFDLLSNDKFLEFLEKAEDKRPGLDSSWRSTRINFDSEAPPELMLAHKDFLRQAEVAKGLKDQFKSHYQALSGTALGKDTILASERPYKDRNEDFQLNVQNDQLMQSLPPAAAAELDAFFKNSIDTSPEAEAVMELEGIEQRATKFPKLLTQKAGELTVKLNLDKFSFSTGEQQDSAQASDRIEQLTKAAQEHDFALEPTDRDLELPLRQLQQQIVDKLEATKNQISTFKDVTDWSKDTSVAAEIQKIVPDSIKAAIEPVQTGWQEAVDKLAEHKKKILIGGRTAEEYFAEIDAAIQEMALTNPPSFQQFADKADKLAAERQAVQELQQRLNVRFPKGAEDYLKAQKEQGQLAILASPFNRFRGVRFLKRVFSGQYRAAEREYHQQYGQEVDPQSINMRLEALKADLALPDRQAEARRQLASLGSEVSQSTEAFQRFSHILGQTAEVQIRMRLLHPEASVSDLQKDQGRLDASYLGSLLESGFDKPEMQDFIRTQADQIVRRVALEALQKADGQYGGQLQKIFSAIEALGTKEEIATIRTQELRRILSEEIERFMPGCNNPRLRQVLQVIMNTYQKRGI